MDKELEKLNDNLDLDKVSSTTIVSKDIPSESLIIYNENETAPLPEILLPLLETIGANKEEWYIYGVKNPESFYKSFMLLTRVDFIIKNKNEKKNEVSTFKREMAMHYETFYKALNYRAFRFAHVDMVHKLTSIDNYCEYDAMRYMADYCRVDLIILDVIDRKYINIQHTPNQLQNDCNNQSKQLIQSKESLDRKEYILIIKYINDTYLPLMNSNGNHYLDNRILEYISRNFERIKPLRYKETVTSNENTPEHKAEYNNIDNGDNRDSSSDNSDKSDSINEITFSDVEEATVSSTGNILESATVSLFFNNTHSSKPVNKINPEPIIKTGALTIAIEDMIEINEPSDGQQITLQELQTIQHANITNIIRQELKEPLLLAPSITTNDPLAELMNKIPDASKLNKSSKKNSTVTAETNISIPKAVISPKKTSGENINTKPVMEEIKPLKTYTLLDLQILAKLYKIDSQKEGKSGKKINKTKEEIHSELLEYQVKRK
jgi:hypothetical protein